MNYKERQDWLKARYPLTVVMDRYSGTYSGAKFLAFPLDFHEVPIEVDDSDTECAYFWKNYKEPVGKGASAQEAIDNLMAQMESEDEKIRKGLIEIFNSALGQDFLQRKAGLDGDKVITYLEKQKKQQQIPTMNGDADLYFDEWNQQQQNPTKRQCFEEGMRYAERLQKEQKSSTNLTTWHRDVVYAAMCDKRLDEAFRYNLGMVYMALENIIAQTPITCEQKEQKPELSEKEEKIINNIRHLLFDHAFENGGIDVNGDYCADKYQEADDFLKSLYSQPKQERSEKPCLTCDEYDKGYKQGYTEGCTVGYNKAMLEQKPTEWSEEDEQNFEWFDKFFRAESVVAGGRDIPQDKYLWFKSLRPQPKWKPTEEQMDALMLAIEGKCPAPTSYMSRRLEDLYEGLANTYNVDCKLMEDEQ